MLPETSSTVTLAAAQSEMGVVTSDNQEQSKTAKERLHEAFPGRDIVGIDCRPLIIQHGSLHCCTMQFPKEMKNEKMKK